MYQQGHSSRLSHLGQKSIYYNHESQQLPIGKFQPLPEIRNNKIKTEPVQPDSLQAFQEQLNSVLMSEKSKSKHKQYRNKIIKTRQKSRTQQDPFLASHQAIELKKQVDQIKILLKSQTERMDIQQKLQKILVQLQIKKQAEKTQAKTLAKTSRQLSHYSKVQSSSNNTPQTVQQSSFIPNQYIIPQPQIIYSPQPYYNPYSMYPPPPYHTQHRRRREYYEENQEQSQQESFYRGSRGQSKRSKHFRSRIQPKTNNKRNFLDHKYKFSKLRVYFFAVAFIILYKNEAKRKAKIRKIETQKFWNEKFEHQANSIKNWLLQSQKLVIPLIIQKKNLNYVFFKQKSTKIKQQKEELLKRIIFIGVNELERLTTQENVSGFIETLSILCKDKSFAVDYFWTTYQLSKVSFSVPLGFFKLDKNKQKYLILLLVFVKIFIFNMLIQPYKFDVKNFPKNQQPVSTNMKLIGSVYYHMFKQIIRQYISIEQEQNKSKLGNWKKIDKGITVLCSQPLTLQKCDIEDNEFISGLYGYQQMEQLGEEQFWGACVKKLKNVVSILHRFMKKKDKKTEN